MHGHRRSQRQKGTYAAAAGRPSRPAVRRWGVLELLVAIGWLGACGGSGAYGYARTYAPASAERAALSGSERYDPVMAGRLPKEWAQKKLNLFGVVLKRDAGREGLTDLTLSVRRLAARNLCETRAEDSCRVTVGDHELSRTHVLLKLQQSDAVGQTRLQPRSLVRIVGQLRDQPHESDGNHVLMANYYRHWPPGTYVTDKAREYMRR